MTRFRRTTCMRMGGWLGLLGWLALAVLPAQGLVLCRTGDGHMAIEVAHGAGEHECLARPTPVPPGCCGHAHHDAEAVGHAGHDGVCAAGHGCIDEPIENRCTTPDDATTAPPLLPATLSPIADHQHRPLLTSLAQPDESPPGDPAVRCCCIVLLI